MTEDERKQAVSEFMRAAGAKGGAARAKLYSKEKLSSWGLLGGKKRWSKEG